MTPADFLTEIVLPTVVEFRDERRSQRRAYLSAIVTYTITDHLKKAGEASVEATMRAAAGLPYDVVRGVANGSKHVTTIGSRFPHVVDFTVGDDYDRPPSFLGVMRLGISRLGDRLGGRGVRDAASGTTHDLYSATAATLRAYVASYPAHFPGVDLSAL